MSGAGRTALAMSACPAGFACKRGPHPVASASHPDYLDPNVIIGGFMSHFFTVPLALIVKQRLALEAMRWSMGFRRNGQEHPWQPGHRPRGSRPVASTGQPAGRVATPFSRTQWRAWT